VVPSANFKVVAGTPKTITATAASGKPMTNSFCGDCGTTLWRHGDAFGGVDGMRIIKAGVLDDLAVINSVRPGAELFAPERVKWVAALDGAGQVDAMPPS